MLIDVDKHYYYCNSVLIIALGSELGADRNYNAISAQNQHLTTKLPVALTSRPSRGGH